MLNQPPRKPVSSSGFTDRGINPVEVRLWEGLRDCVRAHAASPQYISINLRRGQHDLNGEQFSVLSLLAALSCSVCTMYTSLAHCISTDTGGATARLLVSLPYLSTTATEAYLRQPTARRSVLSETKINGHLHGEVLDPVLNEAWEKGGFNCSLLLEPRGLSSGTGFVVDGVHCMRDALLPDFAGVAPEGFERGYFLPGGAAGTQPDAAGPSQLPATAAVAAADGSSQAHRRQLQPQAEGAEQPCDPRLLSLVAALEDLGVGEEADGRDFQRRARILQQEKAAHDSGLVRVGFMGEGKVEDVLARAIHSSIPELWQNGDKIICSVIRQVWLQYVECVCKATDTVCFLVAVPSLADHP